MKITKTKLKEIIREELQSIKEQTIRPKTISDLLKLYKKHNYKKKLYMISDDIGNVIIELSDLEDKKPTDRRIIVYTTDDLTEYEVDITSLRVI
jgi:hypothetical protein